MTQLSMIDLVKKLYEPQISVARAEFSNNAAASTILDPNVDPKLLKAFLIYFNSLGVAMTEPVDNWIKRAGENCIKMGLTELGQALCLHAQHESGHHEMMINDTEVTIKHWNESHKPILNSQEVLAEPITEGVNEYIKLHENVILEAPFGQIAIEMEIERLSVIFGPSLINQCKKVLDPKFMNGLSFVKEHVAIDVSHTHFNEKHLNKLLNQYPEYSTKLVEIGNKALEAYAMFIDDCLSKAKILVAS